MHVLRKSFWQLKRNKYYLNGFFLNFVTDAEQHCKWSGPFAEWLLHHIPNQGEPGHVQGLWVRFKTVQKDLHIYVPIHSIKVHVIGKCLQYSVAVYFMRSGCSCTITNVLLTCTMLYLYVASISYFQIESNILWEL